MMLHVISNCLSKDKKIKNSSCGAAVLELCQALIRNQDYEIFQPGKIKFFFKNCFQEFFLFRVENTFIIDRNIPRRIRYQTTCMDATISNNPR